MYISVVTVMEIESGIETLSARGSARRRVELSNWLSAVLESYGNRVLAFDREVAVVAGRIEARANLNGRNPGLTDIIIAATAAMHRLVVLTQNIRHFTPLGVSAENPFA
jgi:hypothetical protein